jgi:hypothetical protein
VGWRTRGNGAKSRAFWVDFGAEKGLFEDKIARKIAKKREKSQKIDTDFWTIMLILKIVMVKNGVSKCEK